MSSNNQDPSPEEDMATSASRLEPIRRQLEHYFSDRNLRGDRFLRRQIGESQNKPVAVSVIHDFRKMRDFALDDILQATRESQAIELIDVDGVPHVKRKIAFVMPTTYLTPKSKKKATGFEEYFTDAPVTPTEHDEEMQVYDHVRSFSERIEVALQRYKAKRRFQPMQALVFERWMAYGGVTTGPKQFNGGFDEDNLEGLTRREITAMSATNFVPESMTDEEGNRVWEVDFVGIAKGFLSAILPDLYDFKTPEDYSAAINVLLNFYNYLLHHDVCREYEQAIRAAVTVCRTADRELFKCYKVQTLLPGVHSSACSALFDGFFESFFSEDKTWAAADELQEYGLSNHQCRRAVCLAMSALDDGFMRRLAAAGRDKDAQRSVHDMHRNQTVVEREVDVGLEVCSIERASVTTIQHYADDAGSEALGKLFCTPWAPPDFAAVDVPAGHVEHRPSVYEFWLEDKILEHCFVGMKLEGTVKTLTRGCRFLHGVTAVRCSFYTLLANELLGRCKEPNWTTRQDAGGSENGESGGDDDEHDKIK